MKILIVKTSSLGDIVHNLPVISDIKRRFPDASIDWAVENTFAQIPAMHPDVDEVIPLEIRRWRKRLFQPETWREMAAFRQRLRSKDYDLVLDTQGLTKSALVAHWAKGKHVGYNWASARDPFASVFYDVKFAVSKDIHAIERNRRLAASALEYSLTGPARYGLQPVSHILDLPLPQPYIVLLHATARNEKLWPESHWIELAQHYSRQGIVSVLPWGNLTEKNRSMRLARQIDGAIIPPKLDFLGLAALLSKAGFVVGVDTGLTHFAAALSVPVVGLYCGSSPDANGVYSESQGVNLGTVGKPPKLASVLQAVENL